MRISDWSSDVCSSDLAAGGVDEHAADEELSALGDAGEGEGDDFLVVGRGEADDDLHRELGGIAAVLVRLPVLEAALPGRHRAALRSEESRVGKECVSTCQSRGAPHP